MTTVLIQKSKTIDEIKHILNTKKSLTETQDKNMAYGYTYVMCTEEAADHNLMERIIKRRKDFGGYKGL